MANKRFNTTGTCYPEHHYMMDNSDKLRKTLALIEQGNYFTINRPRQYGKTTMLSQIERQLSATDGYIPIKLNFQGVDEKWHQSDTAFADMVRQAMAKALTFPHPDLANILNTFTDFSLDVLSDMITEMAHQSPSKLVLLIDEVDASSQYRPFLTFLGMLRTKYLDRYAPQHKTFHSVVLAGVHDIKSLKYKLHDHEEVQYNSPWNIAATFNVSMSYTADEIRPMLAEYSKNEGVKMDTRAIADRLYYYTAGYPFLISRLCQILAEELPVSPLPTWEKQNVDNALRVLLEEKNTNFDSLIKNLENHKELYDLVYDIVVEGDIVSFNPHHAPIEQGIIYGIFAQNGRVRIHNRIYEQLIYNYMIANIRGKVKQASSSNFQNELGGLDFEQVLLRFQSFMKEQHSSKDKDFLEREWRLVFLAFIKPIINGKGYDFKEVQISEEKRLDVVITYKEFLYVIELKRWQGQKAHEKGLAQLLDYLDRQVIDTGFLVIFDPRKELNWQHEWIETNGKKIFAIWV